MPWTENFQYRPRIYNVLHLLGLAAPLSQTHPAERARLCAYAAGAKIAVEIGTYMGVTASEMASALPDGGMLYCIDPYQDGDSIRRIALRHLKRNGVQHRVQMLYETSISALPRLPPAIDFCFIDGDHSFEGLLADWQVVKEILRPGGVAAFHDTAVVPGSQTFSPGATRCFDEVIAVDPQFQLLEVCMSLSIIQRRQSANS